MPRDFERGPLKWRAPILNVLILKKIFSSISRTLVVPYSLQVLLFLPSQMVSSSSPFSLFYVLKNKHAMAASFCKKKDFFIRFLCIFYFRLNFFSFFFMLKVVKAGQISAIYQMFRAQAAQAEKSSPTEEPAGILPSGIFPAIPVVRQVFMSKLPQLTLLSPEG